MRHASQQLTAAGLMLALVSNRLVNVLVSDAYVWRAHDVTLSVSFALAALLALQSVPYCMLRTKCAVAMVFGAALIDALCVVFNIGGYWYFLFAQAFASIVLGVFYFARSYDQPSDKIQHDGHVYCLRKKPDNLQDFLISLLCLYGPDGGYSLWSDGYMYRYKSGVLVKQRIDKVQADRYHITRGQAMTHELSKELEFITGSKWTWRQNCLTVLGSIWRRHCV